MTAKLIALATSMLVFVAISEQAYAGTTISDTRYWPTEAISPDQSAIQRLENGFASWERPPALETTGPFYQGGPKENY
jgi:hypothetical protein